jgi:Xaa-Pro aminopeptidase
LPAEYVQRRYGVVMHGVGLCDEYPSILYREDKAGAHDGVFEPGMVLCVESLICSENGGEGIKLENQVLITETGIEQLDRFPMALAPEV